MNKYQVRGMTCAACVARVEKAVTAVPGVESCAVSLLTNSMGVEGAADPQAVIAAVDAAGYAAALMGGEGGTAAAATPNADLLKDTQTPRLARRLAVSLVLLAALMYVSMGHMMAGWPLPAFFDENHVAMGLVQLLLSAAIMVVNQQFFISGFKGLWHRSPNMDALVSLGATAAFVYSTVVLFAMTDAQVRGDADAVMGYMHDLYFESAGTILTLITLGKLLESRSKGKTTDALRGLMELAPQTATVVRAGVETVVPVAQVRAGDVFVVRPGEKVPVDGTVLEGSSAVDESALTGESVPADKAAGDAVSAGTLNQSGFMRCEAVRVGEDTTLSQVIRMVSDAAATKAPIAQVADRVSGVFVPVVIALALVTLVVWLLVGADAGYALARAISVLVISCPCALGLATPVAIMVGNGVGAKHGILFKTAASLERTGKAKTVVLDKTGTITRGTPQVTDVVCATGVSEGELLGLAYALEQGSEHPLAGAVVAHACKLGVSALAADAVEGFEALPGNGVRACVDGVPACGGSLAFVATQVGDIPACLRAEAERLAQEGKTPLLFAQGGTLRGVVAVADAIKDDSAAAIADLRSLGMEVVMLTGDNERTARAIGEEAGVDRIVAGVLPHEKGSTVAELAKRGDVIMVGDGINDAPALASASVGMAIGAGSDIAIDAAGVVLVKSRLTDVVTAVRLSRATLRIIHQNLFWAFIYNAIGIPLAAGVFVAALGWQLNPMFAAAAMSLSSFCVVTNALRLNLFRVSGDGRDSTTSPQPAPSQAQEGDEPASAAHGDTEPQKSVLSQVEEEKPAMQKTIKIEGMMCGHCEMHVTKALQAIDGVEKATASHDTGTAVVELSADVADDVLAAAVAEAGYTVVEVA